MASNIEIRIGAIDSASAVIRSVSASVSKFATSTGVAFKSIGSSVSRIGGAIAGVGASIAGPLSAAVVSFAAAGDVLDKMSKRTGVAVESLSELAFAAEQSGSSIDGVERGIRGMQKALLNAEMGSKDVVDAFAAIGVQVESLAGMKPEDQFTVLADALAKIDDPSKKAALSMKVFGRAGSELIPMFNESSRGIANLRQEARELGRQMTTEDSVAAAEFTDAWNRVKSSLSGVKNQIGAALAPALTGIVTRVSGIISGIAHWINNNRRLVQIIATVGAGITALGTVLITIGGTLFATGVAFTGMATAATAAGTVIAAAFSPIGAVIAAVVFPVVVLSGLFLVAAYRVGLLSKGVEAVGKLLTVLAGVAKQTFAGISQAIQDGNWGLAIEIAMAGAKVAFYAGLESIYQSFLEIFPLMWDAAKEFFRMFADLAFKTMTTVAKAVATGGISGAGMLANLLDSALFADGPSLGSGGSEFLAEKKRLAQADLDRLTKPATSGIGQGITPKDGAGAGGTGTQLKEQVDIAKKMLDELKKITDASQKPVGDGTVLAIQVGP